MELHRATLRGFRRHEQVHPLAEPGLVDLTVDADFGACARHGASVDGARVFGSTTQGEWLQRMGIVARLEALGIVLTDELLEAAYARFQSVADGVPVVDDARLREILAAVATAA